MQRHGAFVDMDCTSAMRTTAQVPVIAKTPLYSGLAKPSSCDNAPGGAKTPLYSRLAKPSSCDDAPGGLYQQLTQLRLLLMLLIS